MIDAREFVADGGLGVSDPNGNMNSPPDDAPVAGTPSVPAETAESRGELAEEPGAGAMEAVVPIFPSAESVAAESIESSDDDGRDDDDEPVEDEGPVEPIEFIPEPDASIEVPKDWYILKVQVNREDSIREALQRRVRVAGMDRFFGEIIVPTEDVVEFNKNGKRRVVKKKLYPGYILVSMALNDETWFLVRETSGIGDFTGSAGKPAPMPSHELERILRAAKPDDDGGAQMRTAIPFKAGDRVRVKEGYFLNFEGEVSSIDQAHGRVTVMINIFGRPNPVELDHWQIEAV